MSEPTADASPAPVLLSSLSASAILDGRGDLELLQETRGAPVEWGGAYGQSVRLTGPWTISLVEDGPPVPLSSCRVGGERVPGAYRTLHRWNGLEILHAVAAIDRPTGVVRTVRVSSTSGGTRCIRLVNRFVPFLFPVAVEGIRPVRFRVETTNRGLRVAQRGFGLVYRSSDLFGHLYLDRASWLGGHVEREVREIASEEEIDVSPGHPIERSWIVAGGLERSLRPVDAALEAALSDPEAAARSVADADAAWAGTTPTFRFPQAPGLEAAYGRARDGLRRLYAAPGEELTGLRAGFPWYDAIWCRDVAWMLPAVLWLGDVGWAQRTIDSVFRFQSRSELPILGGEPGELPMQIAPGPIFLYGTSDTTLYYPSLVERLMSHTPDGVVLSEWIPTLQRIVAWGLARMDPETGLLRNGGEVERMRAFTASLTRVRYGIDATDTTIWDSADRRDHAIDVQVLWWQALRSAAALLEAGALPAGIEDRTRTSIRERYWWDSETYLYDSIRNGQPVLQLRPNALRAVSAGLLDPDRARAVVARASAADLTTAWGLRTLSDRDPGYIPHGYHQGQVWPIATTWAADAAFAAGDRVLAYRHLDQLARQLVDQEGLAHECFRGDRNEPYDACFLLGFSVAPFLALLFERVWGISLNARGPSIGVRPAFPAAWTEAALEHLRIGGGFATLRWNRGRLSVGWSGPGGLQVTTSAGTITVGAGSAADIDAPT